MTGRDTPLLLPFQDEARFGRMSDPAPGRLLAPVPIRLSCCRCNAVKRLVMGH